MFEGAPRQNQQSAISTIPGFEEYSNGKDYKKRQSVIRVGNLVKKNVNVQYFSGWAQSPKWDILTCMGYYSPNRL